MTQGEQPGLVSIQERLGLPGAAQLTVTADCLAEAPRLPGGNRSSSVQPGPDAAGRDRDTWFTKAKREISK